MPVKVRCLGLKVFVHYIESYLFRCIRQLAEHDAQDNAVQTRVLGNNPLRR
jgi:hypothetical protein